ncbi:hypothetical protein VD0002_g2522 [Verticillium dahliae]|uniref:Minor extracellular protease vpr n=1 Tax=Verticillium dahliae TaxID=27337 RepID=A0AA44WEE6_VERDA|nr:serine endopeptidase [Verticillium dahliae]PNH30069.1 hypothetical protein BJF96_g6648 [Verticillium dahliae]PNH56091.1 hypothetical protein VD0003_g1558 [Verticillium dahliae]PNH67038.1 hypothetical protein VD0002_g2522 [Verticillium dahliae]
MRFSRAILGLWAIAAAAHTEESPPSHPRRYRRDEVSGPQPEKSGGGVVGNGHYIVEFDAKTDVSAAVNALGKEDGIDVVKVFDNGLFRGCTIKAPKSTVDSIQDKAVVAKAWQSRRLTLGEPLVQRLGGEPQLSNYSVHDMTGVDKLHKANIKGKGAIVGVIDSGINYRHKALGGGFGKGFKVVGGHDFAGQTTWPKAGEVKIPDEDPDDANGHGTHVAGIIAGQSEFFTGVAPEASLYAYKVLSPSLSTDDETLIEAMLRAYDDGVDIISISIGSMNGWADNPWALVADRIVEQGVLVIIAAGNNGGPGAFAADSGSAGVNVVSVASTEPDVIPLLNFKSTLTLPGRASEERWIPYRSHFDWYPAKVKGWPVWPVSLDALDDEACAPLPADTPDLSEVVVLVRRGTCDFTTKQAFLKEHNATHIIVYTNERPLVQPGVQESNPNMAMIPAEDGKAVIDVLKAGGKVTFDFDVRPDLHTTSISNAIRPGLASTFTSVGPGNDLALKSDISAPGSTILSTYLGDGYAILSGTSMATPYIAGVAALYVGQFGGRAKQDKSWAKKLAMRIISSGEPIGWDDPYSGSGLFDALAPVAQVGTGLVNASKVLGQDTSLSFTRFALNDTRHFSRYHKVDITNTGTRPITYTFSQQDYGGLAAVRTASPARIADASDLLANPLKLSPRVSFPRAGFTVNPGQTRTAQFNFAPVAEGAAAAPEALPVYSGRIIIKGSNGDELCVPYLGLAADLKRDVGVMFERTAGVPLIVSGPANASIETKASFTFSQDAARPDFPRLSMRSFFGTRELRWDIFESSWRERQWAYPPREGKAGFVGSVAAWSFVGSDLIFEPDSDDLWEIYRFPLVNVPRTMSNKLTSEFSWFGELGNGTRIAPGRYRMRVASLRPFGNRAASDNWDVFETPEIEVLPLSK